MGSNSTVFPVFVVVLLSNLHIAANCVTAFAGFLRFNALASGVVARLSFSFFMIMSYCL